MPILDKKSMTEEDIKLQYITPVLEWKWTREYITMETKITDGKINLQGNMYSRSKPKKADYILYMNSANPLAVVEAKDNNHTISYGMQQAKEYAKMLNLPFAYSSNGDGFEEYDFLTGKERQFALDEFPTRNQLIARYKAEVNGGKGLNNEEEKFINEPYYTSQNTYSPRYYQRNAVNKTLTDIANGRDRILLVMATGTGKTYTAFQLVWRLMNCGRVQKVLYLADRNNLVDQSIQQDFAPLAKVIHKVNYQKDNKTTITAHKVYFALYQQLVGENDEAHYEELFDKDYFDLIIVDECHRGSAKEESRWRKILEYFSSAIQIGMTATPKETKYVSNINYFGEPTYVYSLKTGIDDGFLAPFKVVNVKTSIGDGWRPVKGQVDVNGNLIEDRVYNNSDYDYNIIVQDRINIVAKEITKYLKATDRMSKTIVFCASEDAAERMRIALTNANADMCKDNPDYVVRITGSDDYGKSKLDYFISVGSPYPVIATTSQLLSTGADSKMVKLIVLDKNIGSMTEFKQIVGRGTRIREQDGKTHFMIMDFRGVTRLFADPNWDGPIEMVEGYEGMNGEGIDIPIVAAPPSNPKIVYVVDKDGCPVEVTQKIVSVYDSDGKILHQESLIDYTKSSIIGAYASLDTFMRTWTAEEKREKISDLFYDKGIDLAKLKEDQKMSEVDDFDFICHIAYNQKPLTRRERADNVKKRDIFGKYGEQAREVLDILLDTYTSYGIDGFEKDTLLEIPPLAKFGKPRKIVELFGGKKQYKQAIKELEEEIYRVVNE